MIISKRPNESISEKYIGDFVDLKLHHPSEFKTSLAEIEAESPAKTFKQLLETINELQNNKYKVRFPTADDFENSTNHVCLQSIVEHVELLELMKFWLNRFGLVSRVSFYFKLKFFSKMVGIPKIPK